MRWQPGQRQLTLGPWIWEAHNTNARSPPTNSLLLCCTKTDKGQPLIIMHLEIEDLWSAHSNQWGKSKFVGCLPSSEQYRNLPPSSSITLNFPTAGWQVELSCWMPDRFQRIDYRHCSCGCHIGPWCGYHIALRWMCFFKLKLSRALSISLPCKNFHLFSFCRWSSCDSIRGLCGHAQCLGIKAAIWQGWSCHTCVWTVLDYLPCLRWCSKDPQSLI